MAFGAIPRLLPANGKLLPFPSRSKGSKGVCPPQLRSQHGVTPPVHGDRCALPGCLSWEKRRFRGIITDFRTCEQGHLNTQTADCLPYPLPGKRQPIPSPSPAARSVTPRYSLGQKPSGRGLFGAPEACLGPRFSKERL